MLLGWNFQLLPWEDLVGVLEDILVRVKYPRPEFCIAVLTLGDLGQAVPRDNLINLHRGRTRAALDARKIGHVGISHDLSPMWVMGRSLIPDGWFRLARMKTAPAPSPGAGLLLFFGLGFLPYVGGVCALIRLDVLETATAVTHCIQLGAFAAPMRCTFCL